MFPEIEGHIRNFGVHNSIKQEAYRVLRELQPDLLILDEAHNLLDRNSARTKRFLSHGGQQGDCRVIVMSGTLHKKSVSYGASRDGGAARDCRLPMDTNVLYSWAQVLDHNAVSRKGHRGLLQGHRALGKEQRRPLLPPSSEGWHVRLRYLTTPGPLPKPRKVLRRSPYALRWCPTKDVRALERLEGLWELPTRR